MTETYKQLNDFTRYEISNFGNVRNIKTGRVLKITRDTRGYPHVKLYSSIGKKTINIHRLVATTFIDNPHNKRTVNHKDGDKSNNHAHNLEWATDRENMKHAFNAGLVTRHKGINSHNHKINQKIADKIRAEYSLGNSTQQNLAKKYQLCQTQISRIVNSKVW